MFYSPCLLHSWQAFLRGSHGSNWLCLLACCCWAWARSACCLEALGCGAPGCTPVLLQPDHGSSGQQLLLERGACYSVSSASTFSAPSLTVPSGSSSWSPATQPQLQHLDLTSPPCWTCATRCRAYGCRKVRVHAVISDGLYLHGRAQELVGEGGRGDGQCSRDGVR